MSNEKPENVTIQPNGADATSEQRQPSEVLNLSLEQAVPQQSSALGVQATEAEISTSTPTAMPVEENRMMTTPSNKTHATVTPSECASCSGGGEGEAGGGG